MPRELGVSLLSSQDRSSSAILNFLPRLAMPLGRAASCVGLHRQEPVEDVAIRLSAGLARVVTLYIEFGDAGLSGHRQPGRGLLTVDQGGLKTADCNNCGARRASASHS